MESIDETKIDTITVRYEIDEDVYTRVHIDLKNGKKSTETDEEKREEVFVLDDGFLLFIKEKILADIGSGNSENRESGEKKIIWYIQVWIEDECYIAEGFEGEDYPSYWEELLEYMQVDN